MSARGSTLLVNGISGMLGLCAALIALAMGATKILGTGRNVALLDRVKALAPERIEVFAADDTEQAPADGVIRWWLGPRPRPTAMASTACSTACRRAPPRTP